MLDKLKLDEGHAEAIVEKGIDLNTYSDDMPDTKKGKIEAAHEILTFAIDAFVNDNVRPDAKGDDDEDTKNIQDAAAEIMELFEMAGITAVKKGRKYSGDLKFGKLPELDDEGEDDDDEAAFDIEDIIEGYEELTAATRIKKIKALDLDPDEDKDYNTLVSIAEWEEAQDKPSSRVLAFIDEIAPPDEGDEDDEDESAEDVGDEPDEDEDEEEAEGEDEPYTKKELAKLDKDGLREIWDAWEMDESGFPKRFTEAGKTRVIEALLEAQSANGDNGDDEEEGEFSEEPWEGYEDLSDAKKIAGVKEFMADEDEPLDEEQLEYVIGYEEAADGSKSLIKKLKGLLADMSEDEAEDEDDEEEEEEQPARRGRRGSKAEAKSDGSKITITVSDLAELLSEGKITLTVE